MGMDQELAAMYGTPGQQSEDKTKVAEMELFAKLAAENGVNLNELSDDQIEQLWNATFAKQAEEEKCSTCKEAMADCKCPPKEAAQKDKLAAAAQAEFQKSQEWHEKVAECDKLGRVMAHAYVQELGLIDEAMKKQAGSKKVAEMPPQFAAAAEEKKEEGGEEKKEEEKKEEPKDEEKEASAIDQLAAKHAVELAKNAGLNEKVAAKRVDAVLTLGAAPTVKTASAKTVQETVHIRALELLEQAGYPVDWSK